MKAPTGDLAEIKLRWKALNEYELRNDALHYIAGKNNNGKRVVLEHEVFDVVAHIHDTLLHAGKNKTFATINEKYHGITRNEV